MATSNDRTLITGHVSHQVYVREGDTKRWVPDLWTMQAEGLSPSDLEILNEDDLAALEEKEAVSSHVPTPPLPEGCYIESEIGVYQFEGGSLIRILNPGSLKISQTERENTIHLPEAILRGFPISGRLS